MESTRKKLITLLAEQQEQYVSGQKLSEELNISRAAIWKHMKGLEKDGYKIDAISRVGYRIVAFPDQMSLNTIQWGLNTSWLGQRMYYEPQLDSTQSLAHKLALEGAEHGTVVIADEQLKGRGRLHRKWDSQKGKGIWMSIILRPPLEPQRAPQLTLASAVAIIDMLASQVNVKGQIKWPNDIFIQNKKVAGILTEMQAEQDLIQYVIIGIGLNVNQTAEEIPEDLQEIATSLQIETEQTWVREGLIQNLLKEIESVYEEYVQNGFGSIKKRWELAAYKMGDWIKVKAMRKEWDAKLIGIQNDGALIVEDTDKARKVLYSAEIDWNKGGVDL
ncbi:BirA family biotin operon repressor/biotin-[acetyl-CoA-carboxylase] ligase [Salirhabdus euzebyi]|uniref:Bifunctional ligase/repressor BirA n=1 Tax=Salirhabdus euzebyi TaxID=394506 RepID=A0A841PTS4_9BACI|nr:biotin--[acetyl-CoA-carboxylase] ligase [Salirhabdus euzebyi]MBB6452229.1 BirA family biotin operon repressor/biotin-[acetyl-CoA-carboxylase] ligase [Salirhabdus euzebyi]